MVEFTPSKGIQFRQRNTTPLALSFNAYGNCDQDFEAWFPVLSRINASALNSFGDAADPGHFRSRTHRNIPLPMDLKDIAKCCLHDPLLPVVDVQRFKSDAVHAA
jgi:hypothetical protein